MIAAVTALLAVLIAAAGASGGGQAAAGGFVGGGMLLLMAHVDVDLRSTASAASESTIKPQSVRRYSVSALAARNASRHPLRQHDDDRIDGDRRVSDHRDHRLSTCSRPSEGPVDSA